MIIEKKTYHVLDFPEKGEINDSNINQLYSLINFVHSLSFQLYQALVICNEDIWIKDDFLFEVRW